MGERLQGGRLAARAIAAARVDTIFTLSGGHVMPIYEGCRHEGVRVVDVRHEQSAAHAAGSVEARPAGGRGGARDRRAGRDRDGDGRRELPRRADAARRARGRAPAGPGRVGGAAGVRPALADEADHEVGRRVHRRRPDLRVRRDRLPPGAGAAPRAGVPGAPPPTSSSRTATRSAPAPRPRRPARSATRTGSSLPPTS